jgi:TPR repeat protein
MLCLVLLAGDPARASWSSFFERLSEKTGLAEPQQSDEVRRRAAELRDQPASATFDQAAAWCAEGRQDDAEDLLDLALKTHGDDASLQFFRGVCRHSRRNTDGGSMHFWRAAALAPHAWPGQASKLAIAIDEKEDVDGNLARLRQLADANPDQMLLPWLIGIECRKYARHAMGVAAFERVFARWNPGPVLAHQTYANILENGLGRSQAALPHRKLAARLEHRAWSYVALARTLGHVGQYEEAFTFYRLASGMNPGDSSIWTSWGWDLCDSGRRDEGLRKLEHGVQMDPSNGDHWRMLADKQRDAGRIEEAIQTYHRGIALGATGAANNLGMLYWNGRGVSQDVFRAVAYYKQAADGGDTTAMRNLANAFDGERGHPRDYAEAMRWRKKAVELGDAAAMNDLALMYERGQGVTRDMKAAVAWYRKAMDQGDRYAQSNLAMCYMKGEGVPKDLAETARLLEALEQAGVKTATVGNTLGWMHEAGVLGVTNMTKAAAYYRMAADTGSTAAMASLGGIYCKGGGIPRDREQGFAWYRKAVEKGGAAGANSFAWMLATSPVAEDRNGEEAVKWALVATKRAPKNPNYADTLAAAYARAGRFEEAVVSQKAALELLKAEKPAPTEDRIRDYQSRIDLYARGEAYVEP